MLRSATPFSHDTGGLGLDEVSKYVRGADSAFISPTQGRARM